MSESPIVKVWGYADSIELNLTQNDEGKWVVKVPPDLSDGTYACEFWAINDAGRIGHWTGFLYMHNGYACLRLIPKRFQLWLEPQTELRLGDKRCELALVRNCHHSYTGE